MKKITKQKLPIENQLLNEIESWCYYRFIAEPAGRHVNSDRIPSNWKIDISYSDYWIVAVKFDEFTWVESEIDVNNESLVVALKALLEKIKTCKVDISKDVIEIKFKGKIRAGDPLNARFTKENWDKPTGAFSWPKHYSNGK